MGGSASEARDDVGDGGPIPPEIVGALWPVGSRDGSPGLVSEAKATEMRALGLLAFDRFPIVLWTSVTVSRNDMEHEFLPLGTRQADQSRRPGARGKKFRSRYAVEIWEAAQLAWPDGMPDYGDERIRRRLMPILFEKRHVPSLDSTSPNAKTFGRALKAYPKKQDN